MHPDHTPLSDKRAHPLDPDRFTDSAHEHEGLDHGHEHGALDHARGHGHHEHWHGDHGEHGRDRQSGVRELLASVLGHRHDPADSRDDALTGSARGSRAVKVSLVGLGITAVLQLAVVVLTGSVLPLVAVRRGAVS